MDTIDQKLSESQRPWSFYGVSCTKGQADTWRLSLARNRCPFCGVIVRKVYNNIARHIRVCSEKPKCA